MCPKGRYCAAKKLPQKQALAAAVIKTRVISQCFLFYEIGWIPRTALIDFERNSVHGKMHFVDAAVGQSGQQHGLGRKIEQPRIVCNCFKIG